MLTTDDCSESKNQAPSEPNSAVQARDLSKSSLLTVGLLALTALMKSLTTKGGSSSISDSTSTHVISMAPSAPGEQGVSFSCPSTVTCFGRLVSVLLVGRA